MGDHSYQPLEGLWSLVKRGISRRVHHVVSAKKLQGYVNAYAFRWDRRNDETPMYVQMFARLARHCGLRRSLGNHVRDRAS